MARKTHVSVVLDRSASMQHRRAGAVTAVNDYLDHLRRAADLQVRVSLVLFNSHALDTVRDREPLAGCRDLALNEFAQAGRTPLFDAVGYAAGLLDCLSAKDERRTLAILTDGIDTASREFTHEKLDLLLRTKQRQEGWQIEYLASRQEAWRRQEKTGMLPLPRPAPAGTRAAGTPTSGARHDGPAVRNRPRVEPQFGPFRQSALGSTSKPPPSSSVDGLLRLLGPNPSGL